MLQDFLHHWQNFINPRRIVWIVSSVLIHNVWICLEWVLFDSHPRVFPLWLIPGCPQGWNGHSHAKPWLVPVLPDKPAWQGPVEPNKTVKIPPPKPWSDSKEPPFLFLLLLPAKEHLPDCFNLQDPSYFNPLEKDWCFGVVLGYIKIHISNNKCFPFIQPSLFSMEPNFQAVSSTFQEYEAPFSSCANAVMPPIIYV